MSQLPEPVSFPSALEKFVNFLKNQKRSSATVTAYKSDLSQLETYLRSRRITQATTVLPLHLQEYLSSLTGNGYTPKSISRKINSLKTFFKFLHTQKLNPQNPSSDIAHPKFQTQPPRILSAEEFRRLREASRLDIRVGAIIEILLQTGMRISELFALKVSDVHKNELVIPALENNASRTITLPHTAAAAIQNYLKIRPDVSDPHLFITKTGHPLLVRNIRTSIDRYFKKADLGGVKVNDLRHTFIAHQLKAGVDPELLSKVVGHRRLASTSKYLEFVKPGAVKTTKLQEL